MDQRETELLQKIADGQQARQELAELRQQRSVPSTPVPPASSGHLGQLGLQLGAMTMTMGSTYHSVISEKLSALQQPTGPSAALNHYQSIGRSLANHDVVVRLREELKSLRNLATPGCHFYLVDGPSGIGKTQLPFGLSADGTLRSHHLLMTLPSQSCSGQSIYQTFAPVSEIFHFSLGKDLKNLHVDNLASDKLEQSTSLWTVAFLMKLMGRTQFDSTSNCTIKEFRNFVYNLPQEERPIFFLDEVLTHSHDGSIQPSSHEAKMLQLARNILRSVGLVVVLMGTNSCAANFVSISKESRQGGAVWCNLITELPRPSKESLQCLGAEDILCYLKGIQRFQSIAAFLTKQFLTCLPWFIELLVKSVKQMQQQQLTEYTAVQFLDELLKMISVAVYQKKLSIRSKIQGLRAQFCLHLDGHKKREVNTKQQSDGVLGRHQTSYFVASHFATLDHENTELRIFSEDGGLTAADGQIWIPHASFVSAKTDAFLYLTLGGGEATFPSPFVDRQSPKMSTSQALRMLMTNHRNLSVGSAISFENSNSIFRDGLILESLSSVAVELASHRKGLAGILVTDFIIALVEELLPTHCNLSWDQQNIPSRYLLQAVLLKRVPYLSSCNDSWPTELSAIPGCCVASLERPPNRRMKDLDVPGCGISGECKNHEASLTKSVLLDILNRKAKGDCWLHLVFCATVQRSYFGGHRADENWKCYRKAQKLDKTCLLKAVVFENTLSLVPLFAGSASVSHRANAVVIFFPIESYLAS